MDMKGLGYAGSNKKMQNTANKNECQCGCKTKLTTSGGKNSWRRRFVAGHSGYTQPQQDSRRALRDKEAPTIVYSSLKRGL